MSDINLKDLTREQIEQLRDQCEKALEKPNPWKPGDKIVLRGKVGAGQDHCWREFDFGPDGVEFVVDHVVSSHRIAVKADGYGMPGKYGNGMLYIKVPEKPQRLWRDWDVVKYSSGNVYVRLSKDVWRCAMAVNRDFVNEHMPDMYFDVHPFLFNLADLLQNPVVVSLTEAEACRVINDWTPSCREVRDQVKAALRRYRGQEEAK